MGAPSAIFVGDVVHHRLTPRRHRLRYRCYWLYLDLDEIEAIGRRLRLFSHNRFNLFAFHDRDHLHRPGQSLREEIVAALREAGIDPSDTRIGVLTMPRVLGYVFNPLSTYFCYGPDGDLRAMVYEVHNTFRERHRYVLAAANTQGRAAQQCGKRFYVSPFMDMNMTYTFRVRPPGEQIGIAIGTHGETGPVLFAAFSGKRRELTDSGLLRVFFAIPLLTMKVVAAIHWEALRIWLKGVRVRPHTPAGAGLVSNGRGAHRIEG